MSEAIAKMRNVPISVKYGGQLARKLQGMKVEKAKKYLEQVLEHKQVIPLYKHYKKKAHLKGQIKREIYADKMVKYFIKLIRDVENNAFNKGMDLKALKIEEIKVGYGQRRYFYQTQGRRRVRRHKVAHLTIKVKEA